MANDQHRPTEDMEARPVAPLAVVQEDEDISPPVPSIISVHDKPAPGLWDPRDYFQKPSHDQVTRRILAGVVVGVWAILCILTFVCFLFGIVDASRFTTAVSALALPLGVVLGYFFSKKMAKS